MAVWMSAVIVMPAVQWQPIVTGQLPAEELVCAAAGVGAGDVAGSKRS